MTIHFVYASIAGTGAMRRMRGKAVRVAQQLGLPISYVGDRERLDTSGWPARAPLSITHHVLAALRKLGRVRFYDFRERVRIQVEPGDILIGHPFQGPPDRVFNRACMEGGFQAVLALVPLHHRMAEYCVPLAPYVEKSDHILGIMGPYWYDTWNEGPFAHWHSKLTPVDMAIDIARFPRVKKRFNPKGKRKFLFIGNGEPYKGAHLLSTLLGLAGPGQACVWVGADRYFPHFQMRPAQRLEGPGIQALAEECDVFLTMGVSDANPTTILEAMAWGFPVACTPQSGYHQIPELAELSINNMQQNLDLLRRFQAADESELTDQADRARKLVESRYSFQRFTDTVTREILRLVPGLKGPAL